MKRKRRYYKYKYGILHFKGEIVRRSDAVRLYENNVKHEWQANLLKFIMTTNKKIKAVF